MSQDKISHNLASITNKLIENCFFPFTSTLYWTKLFVAEALQSENVAKCLKKFKLYKEDFDALQKAINLAN